MKRKAIYCGLGVCVIALLGLCGLYMRYGAKTKVATLNFPDFTVEKMRRANANAYVDIEPVDLERVEKIRRYDMVLVRVHGVGPDERQISAIRAAIAKGAPVFSTDSGNTDINSLDSAQRAYVAALLDNGSVRNYRSLFNYIRREIDGKRWFNGPYEDVVPVPADYFFHLGEDEFFATYADYQAFYENKGLYKPDAPRVALLSGNINMQNSNEEHMAALADSLRARYGVFPGDYMGVERAAGGKAVAVARLQFGNVVILPQPMASAGTDVEKIVHGGGSGPTPSCISARTAAWSSFRASSWPCRMPTGRMPSSATCRISISIRSAISARAL